MRLVLLSTVFCLLLGCERGYGFPEDQRIDGPFQITMDWQTISFEPPLLVNREGIQGLHLVLDHEEHRLYDPPHEDFAFLVREADDIVLMPEVVLIGNNRQEVEVYARINSMLHTGGITMGFNTYDGHYNIAPPLPDSIDTITAMRIRSNEAFTAYYLRWRMDSHRDLARCGGRKCTWWQNLIN